MRAHRKAVNFPDAVGELAANEVCHYMSRGQWNCLEALAHMLAYTGPAKVQLATWKINEDAARKLHLWKADGLITDLAGLIDFRTRSMDQETHQLVQATFDTLVMAQCHAKITVCIGKERKALLLTSANYTNNPRWEFGTISTQGKEVDFYHNALNAAIYGTE